jgi:hypothetical protein
MNYTGNQSEGARIEHFGLPPLSRFTAHWHRFAEGFHLFWITHLRFPGDRVLQNEKGWRVWLWWTMGWDTLHSAGMFVLFS